MKKKDIDPIAIFVDAVANELNRDQYVYYKYKISQYTKLVIPRLEKLDYIVIAFPRLLACITCISWVLWPILLYPALLLWQAVMALLQIKKGGNKFSGDIFFVTSKTSLLFSRSSGFKGIFVYASKKLERFSPDGNSIGSITDYIVLSDIAGAILCSVRSLQQLSKSVQVPGAIFQVYAAFGWFLTWSVLNRSAGDLSSLWICNDRDRWAVLFDRLPTAAQRNIVQHGLLSDPPKHLGFRNPASLPTRLMNINKIILFNKESEHKYRSIVLASDCNTSFYCADGWLINKMPDQDDRSAVRVMIIGQRVHLKQECELANYLAETLVDSRIYVRPHPGFPVNRYKERLNHQVLLIDDLYKFPYAELCICFDFSSLGDFYEKQGSNVIYVTDGKAELKFKEEIMNQISLICNSGNDNVQIDAKNNLRVKNNFEVIL